MLKKRLTLMTGANGTKNLLQQYGKSARLRAVSLDPERRRRLKTVELIEEESSWIGSAAVYLVKIGYAESAARERAKRSRRAMEWRAKAVDDDRRKRTTPRPRGARGELAGAGYR